MGVVVAWHYVCGVGCGPSTSASGSGWSSMATAGTSTGDAADRARPRQAPKRPVSMSLALHRSPPNHFPPKGVSDPLSRPLWPLVVRSELAQALFEPNLDLHLPLGTAHPLSAPRKWRSRVQPAQRPAGPRAVRRYPGCIGACSGAIPAHEVRPAARLRRAVPAEAGVPSRRRHDACWS